MRSRAHYIPVAPPIVGLTLVVVVASAVFLSARPWSTGRPDTQSRIPKDTPQDGSDPAIVAQEITVAFNAIDYRDPDGWLNTLRPMTTDRAFETLETVYVPLVWGLFERDKRVVTRDRINADELGVLAEGSGWEARLVAVEIAGLSAQSEVAVFRMRVLLKREGGGWKLDALLSESEALRMAPQATKEGRW